MAEPAELLRAGHVVELGFVRSAIEPLGYECHLVDEGDASTLPELVVLLSIDEEDRQRTLRLSFVPDASELESTKLLHMFSPLPFTATVGSAAEVREAVAIVNESIALGRFGVQADGTLYFHYILAGASSRFFDDDMLAEVVSFVDFHQEHFGDYLEGVCVGEVSVLVLADVIAQSE